VFGKNLTVVDDDVERTGRAALERGFDAELLLDLGCQTGRPRKVVSNDAVFDGDVHGIGS
jgi:hypothetical protein